MSDNPESPRDKIEQVCAIPFRRPSGQPLEFCVITSIKKKRWIFPKGDHRPRRNAGTDGA